ncbi:MAG: hypothetical protein MZV63_25820 [Marinilabiliales bacterium]|nr:hypothetical protein [Marinilabiliales bacterium]
MKFETGDRDIGGRPSSPSSRSESIFRPPFSSASKPQSRPERPPWSAGAAGPMATVAAYLLYKIFATFIAILPRGFALGLGRATGAGIAYHLDSRHRMIALSNLAQALLGTCGVPESCVPVTRLTLAIRN